MSPSLEGLLRPDYIHHMNLRRLSLTAFAVSLVMPGFGIGCNESEYVPPDEPLDKVDWEFGATEGGAGGEGGGSSETDYELSLERFQKAQSAFEKFMDDCDTFGGEDHNLQRYESLPFWSTIFECRVETGVCASTDQYLCADYPQEWNACFESAYVYECSDGQRFPGIYRCDTFPDCAGAEDELGCQDLWYQCDDGSPVLASQRCDATVQCPDGSDESDCQFNYFQCDLDNGIPSWKVCDGHYDCADESDEKQNCASASCN
jgi:hypothetical protein